MASWLEEPEVTVEQEEVETRQNNACIHHAHMEDEEDDEDDVEMVSVEKHLESFSSYARHCHNPQHQPTKKRYLSGQIWYTSLVPFQRLQTQMSIHESESKVD